MEEKIKNEIISEFSKNITEKSQVVYILSLIRKYIDFLGNNKYGDLKFYCNWALHIQVDDTKLIEDKLKNENIHEIYTLSHFQNELYKFFNENSLNIKFFYGQIIQNKFCKILAQIYTDTPLIIKTIEKEEIVFNKIEWGENNSSLHRAQYTRRKIK